MPHSAKFMKYIISKKRKLDEGGVVSLSANYSAIIKKNLPQKMQDPRSFTIPCTIRNFEFGKALCDSSAGINLMPLSMVKKAKFGGVNSHYNLSTDARQVHGSTRRHPGRCVGQGEEVYFPN